MLRRLIALSLLMCPIFGQAAEPANKNAVYNQIGCLLVDSQGKTVRKFAGDRCVFFPDGTYASGSSRELAMYGANGLKKWSRKIHTHHQLNMSLDGKTLLVLTSNIQKYEGKKVRFDKIALYDLDGNELRSYDFFDHRNEILSISPKLPRGNLRPAGSDMPPGVKWEFSHANSFYEIPANALEEKHPAFKRGNYLVNGLGRHTISVVDSTLKKVLWSKTILQQKHDVQMQESGWLLTYNNEIEPVSPLKDFTTIGEIHPISGQERILYKASPPESFFSPSLGGVQRLANGHLLFSDITKGGRAVEVDGKGKIVWEIFSPIIDNRTGRPMEFQEVRRLDFSDFLKNHKGL